MSCFLILNRFLILKGVKMGKTLNTLCALILGLGGASEAARYTVEKGDNLSQIARQYDNVSWQDIAKANSIAPPYIIHPGEVLEIPERQNEPKENNVKEYIDNIISTSEKKDIARNLSVAFLESRIRHYNREGNVKQSEDDAFGLYQIRECAVRNLNQSTGKKTDRELVRYVVRQGKKLPVYRGVSEGTWSWKKTKKDPLYNNKAGIQYLEFLEERFPWLNGKELDEAVVASFNAGFGHVKKAMRRAGENNEKDSNSFAAYSKYLDEASKKETIPYVHNYRILNSLIPQQEDIHRIASPSFERAFEAKRLNSEE
ncbi:LysM peptidoglycan-binding domain-containing protein [Candidatus Woesearchaeota archaeon]|nr:LysM peptidoglycan-binding domain-containing protein [Candidatus Woesearchaeota archaeon]